MSQAPPTPAEEGRSGYDRWAWRGALVVSTLVLVTGYSPTAPFAQALALHFVGTGFNIWVDLWLIPRMGSTVGERLRAGVNTFNMLLMGHLLSWPIGLWLWLPYNALLSEEKRTHGARYLLWGQIALFAIIAPLRGAPVLYSVAFGAFAIVCYQLAQARQGFLEGVLKEREEQNRRLQQAHRDLEAMHQRALVQEKLSSLGMLAAGIAHEINNPMSYVTHNVRAMVDDLSALPTSPEMVEEYRKDILPATLDGLRRVNSIVADLRRFARGDPEGLMEYDLNEEVRVAARIAHSHFPNDRQPRLELGELPRLLGHPRQLTQVFVNLLVNAAQAIKDQGTVTLSTALEGGQVIIRVRDTGIGMGEETLKKLFQPFFTTKPVGEGTGLGLAVAHGIIRAHGGNITVDSAPGQGTCFTLALPPFPSPELPRAESAELSRGRP